MKTVQNDQIGAWKNRFWCGFLQNKSISAHLYLISLILAEAEGKRQ